MATAFCHWQEKQNRSEWLLPLPIIYAEYECLLYAPGHAHRERKFFCLSVCKSAACVWVFASENESVHVRRCRRVVGAACRNEEFAVVSPYIPSASYMI